MITIETKGNLKKTERFLSKMTRLDFRRYLDKYGEQGCIALASNTPYDTGRTAQSWYYKIEENKDEGYAKVVWCNSYRVKDVCIAIILHYGHGTRNGGYVQGRDYINPALRPVFDAMAEEAWREVTGS